MKEAMGVDNRFPTSEGQTSWLSKTAADEFNQGLSQATMTSE